MIGLRGSILKVYQWALDWIVGKISSQKRLSSIGTCCWGKWFILFPWRYLKDMLMWHWGIWFSDGLHSTRLTGELGDLKGLSQPKWFYITVFLCRNLLKKHLSSLLLILWTEAFRIALYYWVKEITDYLLFFAEFWRVQIVQGVHAHQCANWNFQWSLKSSETMSRLKVDFMYFEMCISQAFKSCSIRQK